MNNFIVTFCFIAGLAMMASTQAPPNVDPQARQQAEKLTRTCQSQEQVTEADMREFSMQRKPSSKSGKCFHACMMESIGLIQEGKLSVENSVKIMGQMSENNEELLKIIEDVSTECKNIEDPDRCELALKVMTCTEEGMKKRQADMRKYLPRQRTQ